MAKEKKVYQVKYLGEETGIVHGKLGLAPEKGKTYNTRPLAEPPKWNNFELVTGGKKSAPKKAAPKKASKKKSR